MMTTVEVTVPAGMSADAVRRLVGEIASSRAAAARVASVLQAEQSPPGPGVAAQLAAVERLWRHLIDRYGAYTSADIAVMRGADPKNRSVATNLAKAHGLIGFTRAGAKLYPAFEFKFGGVHPAWRQLVEPLQAAGWDGEDILLWLVSPHPALSGREPASLIDTAEIEALRTIVENEARGIW
jgi:hypothetical protein